jgi:hypothetical protein
MSQAAYFSRCERAGAPECGETTREVPARERRTLTTRWVAHSESLVRQARVMDAAPFRRHYCLTLS